MRARHEVGWVTLTKSRNWQAHWHEYIQDPKTGLERRTSRARIVGNKSEMAKYQAEEELHKIVAGINSKGTRTDGRVTLEWFWTERFKPMRQAGWSAPTLRGCETDWKHYLKPTLGAKPLNTLETYGCQMVLNKLAADNFSQSVVKRVRVLLSSMLECAADLGFIDKNPARKLKLPLCKIAEKPTLTAEELNSLLAAVTDQRDHLILSLGIFAGLVSSELFGLTWGCLQDDCIEIRSTAYQGELQVGKVKRESRKRKIWLPAPLKWEVERWKASAAAKVNAKGERYYSTADDALMFPNDRRKRGPMWPGIWLQNHVAPIAEKLGIKTPVTFQVLRRSVATRNQQRVKDLQSLLGHKSGSSVTLDVYAQTVPESVREMIAADYEAVMAAKPKAKAAVN